MGNRLFHMMYIKSREKLMTDEGKQEIATQEIADQTAEIIGGVS